MPIPAPSIPPIPSSSGLVLAVLAFAAMALAGCLIGLPPRDAERGTRTTTTTTAPAPRQERPADTLPSWVHQPPTDAHLAYGVGASLDHRSDRAIIEARRDLAKRLNIVIHGVPQAEADSDPDRAPVDVDFLELPVIEVVRQEDTTTCTYVLISLDRSVWAERLGRRLDHLNRQIRETLAVLQAQPEVAETRPIATVARQHQRLLPFLTERALRVRQLKVADPGAVPPHPPVTLTALQERLAQVLDPVTVEIVAPPDLEPIMPQLVAGCARLGLVLGILGRKFRGGQQQRRPRPAATPAIDPDPARSRRLRQPGGRLRVRDRAGPERTPDRRPVGHPPLHLQLERRDP